MVCICGHSKNEHQSSGCLHYLDYPEEGFCLCLKYENSGF